MTLPSLVSLNQLARGQRAKIARIEGERMLRRRLLDMGLIAGEELTITAIAPLGDPIEVSIKGYRLSLRKLEASLVWVEAEA